MCGCVGPPDIGPCTSPASCWGATGSPKKISASPNPNPRRGAISPPTTSHCRLSPPRPPPPPSPPPTRRPLFSCACLPSSCGAVEGVGGTVSSALSQRPSGHVVGFCAGSTRPVCGLPFFFPPSKHVHLFVSHLAPPLRLQGDGEGAGPLPGSRSAPTSAGPTRRRLHHDGTLDAPGEGSVQAQAGENDGNTPMYVRAASMELLAAG